MFICVTFCECPFHVLFHLLVTLSLSFFFRFVVLPSSTYLFTVGVEGFLFSFDHTQTHTTVGRTSVDEGSARRRDLYLTTQTLYKRQTSMPSVGFEPTITASTWSHTYALGRETTEMGLFSYRERQISECRTFLHNWVTQMTAVLSLTP
jgi:hypothetical protein